MAIDKFDGENYFLSNFSAHPIKVDNLIFPTVEHAFQAMKTIDANEREAIRLANSPGQAKRMGRKCLLRNDWEDIKEGVMFGLVLAKFSQHPDISKRLIATGDEELIEGNHWGDTYWGVCRGVGQNKLGKILMRIRKQLVS